ncbi:MAG: L,D-transpeptidase [Candidatus Coatesbacteria bacterium]|nr:L,D-transpeptidase [Candidatus Coatesbacteria bacterium]
MKVLIPLLLVFSANLVFSYNTYEVYITLNEQRLYLLDDGEVIYKANISSGTDGYPTPPGRYHLEGKEKSHFSSKFEVMMLYWMPFSGGYGMHALEGRSYLKRLGSPASHGCVRLSHADAAFLYSKLPIGTPIIVSNIFNPPPPENIIVYFGRSWDIPKNQLFIQNQILFAFQKPFSHIDEFWYDFWGWNYGQGS